MINLVPFSGVFPLSLYFDTIEAMAKTVVDLANLLDVLVDPRHIQKHGSYIDALPGDFSERRIGVLRPYDWCHMIDHMSECSRTTGIIPATCPLATPIIETLCS